MIRKNRRRSLVLLSLLVACCAVLPSCAAPDPVRLKSERANWRLATRCADGWFGSKPATEHDEKLVRDALSDWDKALTADEELVGWPLGGRR